MTITVRKSPLLVAAAVLATICPLPTQDPAARVPTPQLLWQRFRAGLDPLALRVTSDRVVAAESDPSRQLRRVDFSFTSQRVPCRQGGDEGADWVMRELWHDGTIFVPTGRALLEDPARRGKVVIVGGLVGPWRQSFLSNYGDPLAVRTGYPTMILPNPGETRDRPGVMYPQQWLMEYRQADSELCDHSHFRWAVPFLRGMDVMAEVLKLDPREIRAIIGGHSKRATGAYTAAAIDPGRIAGVVFMGNESLHPTGPESRWWAVSPYYTQRFVRCPVFYIGATNEGGYAMFDINKIQDAMTAPWTFEIIPNYKHASECEKQFLDWRMWVAHVFDGRPLARIGQLEHEDTDGGTRFRVRIDAPNTLILTQLWYVYCDDPPYWRDLTWYPTLLQHRGDDLYEGYVHGQKPDACLVEVLDTGSGTRGYVTGLPQKLTDVPVARRDGQGRPRTWRAK